MNKGFKGETLRIPIRLENADGVDITGAAASNIDVNFAYEDDGSFTVLTPTTDYVLDELSKGQYWLEINAAKITKTGNVQIVVENDGYCPAMETRRYSAHVEDRFNLFFKSTGNDSTGNGSVSAPYQSLSKCLSRIGSVPGYTIHVLDSPANVAGNKDQDINEPVTIKGYGRSWTSPVPTNYHISVNTNAKAVVLEDLNDIKINLDSSSFNTVMRRCENVSYISRFSENGHFEDCIFSAAITGGGTDFGKRAKWLRCVFKENVDCSGVTQDGGIFKDCVFEKDLKTAVAQYTLLENCQVLGNYTGSNNIAFNGQVTLKNPYIAGNATIDGKKYVIMDGVIRGNLTLQSNSVDCLFWKTRIKGTISDSGTGNEIKNEADFKADVSGLATLANQTAIKAQTDKLSFNGANRILSDVREVNDADVTSVNDFKADVSGLALESSVQAVKAKTDNLPADPASESNVSAVGSAVVAVGSAVTVVDGKVDAVKAKTDKLTFNAADIILADIREVNDAAVSSVNDFKADVSGLATLANQTAIKAKTDLLTFTGNNVHSVPQDLAAAATAAIDTKLSTTHGAGSWETSEVTIRANSRLKEITYDDYGNPIHYLEYIYADRADAEADQNPTKILDVTSTYAQDAENENRWQLTGRLIKDVTP